MVKRVRTLINTSRLVAACVGASVPVLLMGARGVYSTSLRVRDVTVDIPTQVKTNTTDIRSLRSDIAGLKISVDSIVRTTTISSCIAVHQQQRKNAQECVQ